MKKFKLFDSLLAILIAVTIFVTAFAVYVVAANNETQVRSSEDEEWPTYAPSFVDTSYNDVSIPLADFPAYTGIDGSMKIPAKSNFKNGDACRYYGGSRQCDGFARYAFDCFWHLEDWNRTNASWVSAGTFTADYHSEDELTESRTYEEWVDFFNGLSIGSVVRYGSQNDPTRDDGKHTILFMGVDADGYILAYECNQDAFISSDPKTNHCGVDYQKYSIEKINERYDFVLYYVEHALEGAVYENATHHTVGCANCAGYLRQTHSTAAQKTGHDLQQHKISYGCCNGYTLENHTDASPTIQQYNAVKHKKVYDCCGAVYENHEYNQQGSSPGATMECKICHYSVLLNNTGLEQETE